MRQILSITRKELDSYFGSPMALLFMGAFLVVTLFTFFWVDSFFARGIADVRPLFQWMPLLLIFLVAALTMRQWSDEQRMGTQEILLTLPVQPWKLVIGKFLAVMTLVLLALILTLPLPISVSLLGNLDWGPVIGGYVAALLLASAYAALGLFISSRTDNQIVALISTALVGGILYMLGSQNITSLFGEGIAGILRKAGTGSRFESIERGVIDLRDLLYYLSITAIFLILNTFSLDTKRWSQGTRSAGYRTSATTFASLAVANLLVANFWMAPLTGLRADLTQQKEYSLSPVTKNMLGQLQEPLLIRGYISEKSHPLLNPLRPYIEDLLREYTIAGKGKVTAEVIDPASDPELEAEANQSYNIRPTPFQIQDKYQASVVNSYFDILVRYGDQDKVLSFRDLIQIEPKRDMTIDVKLRNLEYDLTSTIKKVVFGFQSAESVLSVLEKPAELTLFVTPNLLPEQLKTAPDLIEKVAKELGEKSGGKLIFSKIDPDAPDSQVKRQQLIEQYNLQAFPVSLFSPDSFYLHMLLRNGDKTIVLYPPNDPSEGALREVIESSLKRTSTGFLKVIGLWTPSDQGQPDPFTGQPQQPISTWQMINQKLTQEYTVKPVDLSKGLPPDDVDTLVVVMPQALDDKALFAIDQFLMRGRSVIVAAGNYKIDLDQFGGGLTLKPLEGSLRDMLLHYGIDVQQSIVMDSQNTAFPLPVQRDLNGFSVQEIQALNFPFFVDVRREGMNNQSGVTAGLNQVTMNFASPVVVSDTVAAGRETQTLISSSEQSWLRSDTTIQPNPELYGEVGYAVEGEQKSFPLGVSMQGTFTSFFKDKPAPFSDQPDPNQDPNQPPPDANQVIPSTVITSAATARLVVIGSGEFLDDIMMQQMQQLDPNLGGSNLQFLQNAVDWSVEDTDLLTIRARGSSTHILDPMDAQTQRTWEMGNYIAALLALLGVSGIAMARRRNERPMELV